MASSFEKSVKGGTKIKVAMRHPQLSDVHSIKPHVTQWQHANIT
jgi:hypothetical protein